MLQAVLNAKIRGLFDKVEEGVPWRKAYSNYEDFLTAAVMGRLIYLPGEHLWSVIKQSSMHVPQLPIHLGNFVTVDFWPNWKAPNEVSGNSREPDVFLSFELADVIVEAKRDDWGGQYYTQWCDEILSYRKFRHDTDREKRPIILWVLGGLGKRPDKEYLSNGYTAIKDCLASYPDEEIYLAGASWASLLDVITDLKDYYLNQQNRMATGFSPYSNNHILRILEDIHEAMRLHGIREWHLLEELPTFWGEKTINTSALEYFYSREPEAPPATSDFIGWKELNAMPTGFKDGLNYFGG